MATRTKVDEDEPGVEVHVPGDMGHDLATPGGLAAALAAQGFPKGRILSAEAHPDGGLRLVVAADRPAKGG